MYASRSPQTPVDGPFCSTNSASSSRSLRVRHRDVARQDVVERRDVGRALDGRVAAQREDAAARAADVAEQQLDDRRGADVSARRRCAASSRPRSRSAEVRSRPEFSHSASATCRNARAGTPQISLDQLRRVAREVALAGSGRRSAGARGRGPCSGGSPCSSAMPCAPCAWSPETSPVCSRLPAVSSPVDALRSSSVGPSYAPRPASQPEKSAVEVLGVAEARR